MPDDFSFGCPVCGYAIAANAPPEPIKPQPSPLPAPPLPWWAFLAVGLTLMGLLLVLLRSLG